MKYLFHYTYRITNTKLKRHYYGVKSCNEHPKLNLGIKYFSSSTDKEFKKDQKLNSSDYKYKVIYIFETREEAMLLEIKLHNRFDVACNPNFYNRCKSTCTGFDLTGTKFTQERRIYLSKIQSGRKHSDDTKEKIRIKSKGRNHTPESKIKMSESKKGCDNSHSNKHISVLGMIYESIRMASDVLNIKFSTLSYRLISSSEKFEEYYYLDN